MANANKEKNNEQEVLELPSLLSFEGKIACSDAILRSGVWEEWQKTEKSYNGWKPVKVEKKAVRGTISNHFSKKDSADYEKDPAKLDKKVENANPQVVDHAALPVEHDLLRLSFTLKVLGKVATSYACNKPEYQDGLNRIVDAYVNDENLGFSEIAKRYAVNIANGRFLWRNRVGADEIKIKVKIAGSILEFNAYDFLLRDFKIPSGAENDLNQLSQSFVQALKGKKDNDFSLIEVDAYVNLGKNQTVFPSQEMVLGTSSGDQRKFLYEINFGNDKIAAMHSQKIGNAIRTIDNWHNSGVEVGAIAIEPYGSVTNRGQAYRKPIGKQADKQDFYSLIDRWINNNEITDEQKHYVIAILIRGGVFSKAKEKNS